MLTCLIFLGFSGSSSYSKNRDKCHKCNKVGHYARDCKEEQARCYRCSGEGHFAKDCHQSPDVPSCYNCRKPGKVQHGLHSAGLKTVFFIPGHIARSCPEGNLNERVSDTCHNCQRPGHISRNCPENAKTCYLCHKSGHLKRECPENQDYRN